MASVVMPGTLVTYLAELASATVKIMLLKDTYVPNQDHKFVSDIVAYECDATNYAGGYGGAGRKTISGKTIVEDAANNRATWDATDPSDWTSLGGASSGNNTLGKVGLIEETGGSDATARVLAVLEFTGGARNTNGGDFGVSFNALGIVNFNC